MGNFMSKGQHAASCFDLTPSNSTKMEGFFKRCDVLFRLNTPLGFKCKVPNINNVAVKLLGALKYRNARG